ncbi:hypothetical protein A2456_00070 [Candidatus Nomurabacteria bacterium RIFOXYC2_FULL_36_19]|nr:MAG: hypothetical protein A2238_00565 [Candidatus Nomurabacteria bacterium RIFOXYA2_FULL_35_9]OGJ06148.1 MAG: hypothetical protein A2192_01740 [Candidatus Nomurabacteria bacterium RIFOXYA1_FULL_35_17]OGJ09735.1 MAG: hypothetical protein A2456_00070 [Candidatus Nomurabacteria bacterium RIFOXYC2_FULL_36_19]OGJ14578.1 MAG: hypothetical protein A2554_02130 [Candidatus Nomurabacteria bacterium RIFOXYD2_FULL_35_12]
MGYLYILKSEKNGRYYIGSTNNLERRLAEHNSGHTASIKNLLPLRLVFSKIYANLKEARKMELHLKRMKSRSILEKIIEEKTIKTNFRK